MHEIARSELDEKPVKLEENKMNLVAVEKPSNKRVVETFLSWSQSVTFHCFPKIFKEKTHVALRLLWSFIFFSFAGLTFYVLINNILAYFQFSSNTSFQLINERPALFPTITICDSNAFTTKFAQNLIANLSLSYYGINISKMSNMDYSDFAINNLSLMVNSHVNDPKFGDDKRKLLGFNLSQTIQKCKFNHNPCDFTNDFNWIFHYDYGNCFQYNVGLNLRNESVDLKSVSFGSKYLGLSFTVGPLINENSFPLTPSKGLIVYIHNHTETPNIYKNFLSIEPGKDTNIMIDRKIGFSLPSPYSECVDLTNGFESEFYQILTNNDEGTNKAKYHQYNCFALCIMQKPIEDECGCYYTAIARYRLSIPCINLTQVKCFSKKMSFITNNLQLFMGKCAGTMCPLECDSYEYNTQVTSLDYPSIEFYKLLEINKTQSKYNIDLSTYDLYKQYFYSLNFYYSSTIYTYVSESPQMTFVSLLSALGGSLGMFVGLSVFSLLEIFEVLFRILWVSIADKLCLKKTNK
jgi:hypothetical protein